MNVAETSRSTEYGQGVAGALKFFDLQNFWQNHLRADMDIVLRR